MNFNLLFVPEGFSTEVVLVISPYVDKEFLKQIVERTKPKRLCLMVDDGIRWEDLDPLKEACKPTKLEIRLARTNGLVHMKLFYFQYIRDKAPRHRKHRLLYGSANATDAAFCGVRNAELIVEVDLARGQDLEVVGYCEEILSVFDKNEDARQTIQAREITLSKPSQLYLPKFTALCSEQKFSGFDSWLQRGVLAAKYKNNPQFLNVIIQLKKTLPKDVVASIFQESLFAEKEERNKMRYAYLGQESITQLEQTENKSNRDSKPPLWKSKFGVWTQFGDWISEDCYKQHKDEMKSGASDRRKSLIGELLKNGSNHKWQTEKTQEFLNKLFKVWYQLRMEGIAKDYLREDEEEQGTIDSQYYAERLEQKIKQDFALASEPDFEKRYVKGYEFTHVPKFRQDALAWKNFVRSWCESVIVEAAKQQTKSLVTKRIKKAIEEARKNLGYGKIIEELNAYGIEKFLGEYWEKEFDENITVGQFIMNYGERED